MTWKKLPLPWRLEVEDLWEDLEPKLMYLLFGWRFFPHFLYEKLHFSLQLLWINVLAKLFWEVLDENKNIFRSWGFLCFPSFVLEVNFTTSPSWFPRPREDRLRALSALCVAAYLGVGVFVEKMQRFLVPVRLAHKEQQRKSGEPYIVHPVAVAELLALLKADWTGLNFWHPFLTDVFFSISWSW